MPGDDRVFSPNARFVGDAVVVAALLFFLMDFPGGTGDLLLLLLPFFLISGVDWVLLMVVLRPRGCCFGWMVGTTLALGVVGFGDTMTTSKSSSSPFRPGDELTLLTLFLGSGRLLPPPVGDDGR